MLKYLIFVIILFFLNPSIANEHSLTVKQQLDRLQREVSDLSQQVYSGVKSGELKQKQSVQNNSNLTAFDLRIYDLEKDLQKLNEYFEELTFQIDDLKNLFEELSLDLSTKSVNNKNIKNNQDITIKDNNENSLGNITINSEDLSDGNKEALTEGEAVEKDIIKLSPDEEFQQAFTLIRNQNYKEAIKALQNFKDKYQENILSGSAHYWLGEMYLLNKDYSKAAIEWAEGYEKYPKSIKASDMLYKLSESLVYLDKIEDSCRVLRTFTEKFIDNKLTPTVKNKIISLECN